MSKRMLDRPAVQHAPAACVQRLLFAGADEHGHDNTLNVVVSLHISGDFDRSSLERTLQVLVDRHEALRTTLRPVGDDVEQAIWDALPPPIDDLDLRAAPGTVHQRVLEFADADVNLKDGGLFSVLVVTLGASDHVVVLKMHHSISDGISCAIVTSEFCQVYRALTGGDSFSLPPLESQFRDYVAHELADVSPSQHAFWKKRLASESTSPERLVDAPSLQRRRRIYVSIPGVGRSTVAGLADLAAEARISQATASLAAVASSFIAWSYDSATIGVLVANRYTPGLRGVVGPIINTQPVEISLSGDPSFREMLARTREAWVMTLAHRIPLHHVGIVSGRDLAESLFCDVEFNHMPSWNGTAAPAWRDEDHLRIEPSYIALPERRVLRTRHTCMASWELVFAVDDAGGLDCTIGAEQGAASAHTLTELGGTVVSTLTRAVSHPDQPLRRLIASGA